MAPDRESMIWLIRALVLGDHVRRVYLTWSNGRIDYAQSYIQVGDFCRPTGTLSIHTGLQYLDNGIFRAEVPAESARV